VLIDSPLGTLRLSADSGALVAIRFDADGPGPGNVSRDSSLLERAADQLAAWFAGTRVDFDLPLRPNGTEFQRTVWAEVARIPFGQTRSYGDIARSIGHPDAVRAVGAANGRNPLPLVIPCHRVIGADGALTGYAGGLERKRWLLARERPQLNLELR